MPHARRVKAGIVGCGDVSLHGYFGPVSEIFELVATCDRIEARSRAMARIWGARQAYTDFDEMLATADIEAVFVLSSMASHDTLSLRAVQAGKHFLVQKPFATRLDRGLAVVQATRKTSLKGLAEPNYWQDPVYVKAKEIIDQGHIGAVRYSLARSENGTPSNWGGTNFVREGGGVLCNLGVYLIAALTYLLGPARAVTGAAKVSVPHGRAPIMSDDVFTSFLERYQKGDDPFGYRKNAPLTVRRVMEAYDNDIAVIEWPDHCLGCVTANYVSFVLPPFNPRLFLCGEKGTIAFSIPGSGSRLSVATLDKESEYHVSEGSSWTGTAGVGWYHFPSEAFPAWDYMAGSTQHLHDCIVNDADPMPSIEWGLHVAEIMIKTLQSSEQGRTLDLITSF